MHLVTTKQTLVIASTAKVHCCFTLLKQGSGAGTHTPTVPDSSKPASGPSDGGLDDDLLSRLAALKGGK